jgi:hypothetical protein
MDTPDNYDAVLLVSFHLNHHGRRRTIDSIVCSSTGIVVGRDVTVAISAIGSKPLSPFRLRDEVDGSGSNNND